MTTKRRISSLTIKGFKSIRHLEDFRLQGLNVLIGGNGVGKSNFIDYFRMLSKMMAGRLQVWVGKQGGADRLLSYGVKESPRLTSVIHFGGYGFSFQLEPDVDGTFVFTDEFVFLKKEIKTKKRDVLLQERARLRWLDRELNLSIMEQRDYAFMR